MHYKQNNKESKTYVQGLRPFGNTLPRGLRGILKKNGYNYSEIISKWTMLIGKDLAEMAKPRSIKMKNDSSGGVLVLAIKRGDEINIEYSKKKIIDRINGYFGYKLINDIKIQSFGAASNETKKKNDQKIFPENIKEKINTVKNTRIKNSLTMLLNAMKND